MLNDTELKVVAGKLNGLRNGQIAQQLGLHVVNVNNALYKAMIKLNGK